MYLSEVDKEDLVYQLPIWVYILGRIPKAGPPGYPHGLSILLLKVARVHDRCSVSSPSCLMS